MDKYCQALLGDALNPTYLLNNMVLLVETLDRQTILNNRLIDILLAKHNVYDLPQVALPLVSLLFCKAPSQTTSLLTQHQRHPELLVCLGASLESSPSQIYEPILDQALSSVPQEERNGLLSGRGIWDISRYPTVS